MQSYECVYLVLCNFITFIDLCDYHRSVETEQLYHKDRSKRLWTQVLKVKKSQKGLEQRSDCWLCPWEVPVDEQAQQRRGSPQDNEMSKSMSLGSVYSIST